jgi:hypothetical protein
MLPIIGINPSTIVAFTKVRSSKLAKIGRVLDSINTVSSFPYAVTSSQKLVHSSVHGFEFFLKMKNTDPLIGAN